MAGKMSCKAKRKMWHLRGGVSRGVPRTYKGERPLQCTKNVLKIDCRRITEEQQACEVYKNDCST